MTMSEHVEKIQEILRTAAQTHHVVFGIADGEDPDWASWYSEWLINLSQLPAILGAKPVRSELTYWLVRLDKDYVATKPDEPWEENYARSLMEQLGAR